MSGHGQCTPPLGRKSPFDDQNEINSVADYLHQKRIEQPSGNHLELGLARSIEQARVATAVDQNIDFTKLEQQDKGHHSGSTVSSNRSSTSPINYPSAERDLISSSEDQIRHYGSGRSYPSLTTRFPVFTAEPDNEKMQKLRKLKSKKAAKDNRKDKNVANSFHTSSEQDNFNLDKVLEELGEKNDDKKGKKATKAASGGGSDLSKQEKKNRKRAEKKSAASEAEADAESSAKGDAEDEASVKAESPTPPQSGRTSALSSSSPTSSSERQSSKKTSPQSSSSSSESNTHVGSESKTTKGKKPVGPTLSTPSPTRSAPSSSSASQLIQLNDYKAVIVGQQDEPGELRRQTSRSSENLRERGEFTKVTNKKNKKKKSVQAEDAQMADSSQRSHNVSYLGRGSAGPGVTTASRAKTQVAASAAGAYPDSSGNHHVLSGSHPGHAQSQQSSRSSSVSHASSSNNEKTAAASTSSSQHRSLPSSSSSSSITHAVQQHQPPTEIVPAKATGPADLDLSTDFPPLESEGSHVSNAAAAATALPPSPSSSSATGHTPLTSQPAWQAPQSSDSSAVTKKTTPEAGEVVNRKGTYASAATSGGVSTQRSTTTTTESVVADISSSSHHQGRTGAPPDIAYPSTRQEGLVQTTQPALPDIASQAPLEGAATSSSGGSGENTPPMFHVDEAHHPLQPPNGEDFEAAVASQAASAHSGGVMMDDKSKGTTAGSHEEGFEFGFDLNHSLLLSSGGEQHPPAAVEMPQAGAAVDVPIHHPMSAMPVPHTHPHFVEAAAAAAAAAAHVAQEQSGLTPVQVQFVPPMTMAYHTQQLVAHPAAHVHPFMVQQSLPPPPPPPHVMQEVQPQATPAEPPREDTLDDPAIAKVVRVRDLRPDQKEQGVDAEEEQPPNMPPAQQPQLNKPKVNEENYRALAKLVRVKWAAVAAEEKLKPDLRFNEADSPAVAAFKARGASVMSKLKQRGARIARQ